MGSEGATLGKFTHSLVRPRQVPGAALVRGLTEPWRSLLSSAERRRGAAPRLPAAGPPRAATPPGQAPLGPRPTRPAPARRAHVTAEGPAPPAPLAPPPPPASRLPPAASAASAGGGTRSAARRGPGGSRGGERGGRAASRHRWAGGKLAARNPRGAGAGAGRRRGGGDLRRARGLTWRGRGRRDPGARRGRDLALGRGPGCEASSARLRAGPVACGGSEGGLPGGDPPR